MVAGTLGAHHGNVRADQAWQGNLLQAADPEGISRPLVSRSTGYRMDLETENFLVANGLRAADGHHGHSSPRGDGADNLIPQVADPLSTTEGKTYTHEGSNNFRTHNLVAGVRRLTPLECERLMGWPDDHTRWTMGGHQIADAHRYRMCGNGVVAPVAEWIAHRLAAVDAGMKKPPTIGGK